MAWKQRRILGSFGQFWSAGRPLKWRAVTQGDDWQVQVPATVVKGQKLLVYKATGSLLGRKRITGTRTTLDLSDLGTVVYTLHLPNSPMKPLRFVRDK